MQMPPPTAHHSDTSTCVAMPCAGHHDSGVRPPGPRTVVRGQRWPEDQRQGVFGGQRLPVRLWGAGQWLQVVRGPACLLHLFVQTGRKVLCYRCSPGGFRHAQGVLFYGRARVCTLIATPSRQANGSFHAECMPANATIWSIFILAHIHRCLQTF